MGVILATSNHAGGTGGANEVDSSIGFDQAGRMTDESTDQTDSNMEMLDQTDAQRQYDSENHITKETYWVDNQGISQYALVSYAWGAAGHVLAIGSAYATAPQTLTPSYDTLHWDGDELLFTTNQQGKVDDLKVGDLADITPSNGIVFYDRGFGSDVSFCHSATAVSGNGTASPYSRTAVKYGTHPRTPCGLPGAPGLQAWSGDPNGSTSQSGVGSGAILAMPHGDGISDGYNTVQGVRSFSSESGIWTAPDALSGTVVDPATQKSYMWNGDNPVSYSDSSGYYATIGLLEQSSGTIDNFDNTDTALTQAQSTTGNGTAPKSPPRVGTVVMLPGKSSPADAAMAAGEASYDASKRTGTEYGGRWFCFAGSRCGYSMSPAEGKHSDRVDPFSAPKPPGTESDGVWHTHVYLPSHSNENFSDTDVEVDYGVTRAEGFLITPNGSLKMDVYIGLQGLRQRDWQPLIVTLCKECIK